MHRYLTNPSKYYEIDETTGCWNWRQVNWNGYGVGQVDGRTMNAHRAMYELMRGPVPSMMDVDHLCRNRRCVNPDHMEIVTRQENIRRSRTLRLSDDDVAEVRALAQTMMQKDIAKRYGVSRSLISLIVNGHHR